MDVKNIFYIIFKKVVRYHVLIRIRESFLGMMIFFLPIVESPSYVFDDSSVRTLSSEIV